MIIYLIVDTELIRIECNDNPDVMYMSMSAHYIIGLYKITIA